MPRNYLFFGALVLVACSSVPPRNQPGPAQTPEAVIQALAAAGVPYHRGGQSPASGFDCSGLVAHVFREAYGIRLPHNARAQSRMGKAVSPARLQAGDLVFYNTERPFSHVGIYLGDDRFIHAPRPGASVRVENMRSLYWERRFDGARRIGPDQDAR